MVLLWRRAFCTSIPKDEEQDPATIREKHDPTLRIRSSGLGRFFSEPSTPRLQSRPVSPTLRCRTTAAAAAPIPPPGHKGKPQCKNGNGPRCLLKSRLRLSKSRCGLCLQSVKKGQGTAVFTAECGHSFHFPCFTADMTKQGSLTCPICNITWKQMQLFTPSNGAHSICSDLSSKNDNRPVLKVYNDDEPLCSGARFNPILESDETEEENDEFPGFFPIGNGVPVDTEVRSLEAALLSEAAVISVGKTSETYAVVLRIRATVAAPPRRAPVDLVTVLNVSRNMTADHLRLMRRAMRTVVSSFSVADRLSVVAFSTTSKRLLPLRRMATSGRRCARRIIDAVVALDDGDGDVATSAAAALKKAAKVLDDRRERNATAAIMLLTDGHRGGPFVTSTRLSDSDIPVHSVNLSADCLNSLPGDTIGKFVTGPIGDVVQDLRIQLGFTPGSAPGEISAMYSCAGRPAIVGYGSGWARVGNLHSSEERDLLIELKVPSSMGMAHRVLSVRCSFKDPSTHRAIRDEMECPLPRADRSSAGDIQKLRCLFVTTRAVAESRRMAERGDLAGAHHLLASAQAVVQQTGSEFVRRLEDELAELSRRTAEKVEQLTPTSAWRAAGQLAKVAIMRKSLNRVRDLHGFENMRF